MSGTFWLGVFLGVWVGAALAVGLSMIRQRYRRREELFTDDSDWFWKDHERAWHPYSE